jgi:hypothetical protein
MSQV